MKTILAFTSALLLATAIPSNAIDGAPTGWWTDADGVNHYGSPTPSYSSSSSYSTSSSGSSGSYSYGPSLFDQAVSDAFKGADDFQKRFQQNQEKQRLERERRKREWEKLFQGRKTGPTGSKPNLFAPSRPSTAKPAFPLANLNRTGNDWKPVIFDLKPRAVASQIRSGDNYARKGQWDQAINHYQSALRVDPTDKLAKQKLATAQKAKKNAPVTKKPAMKKPLFKRRP